MKIQDELTNSGRRNVASSVEEDGDVDIPYPAIRILTIYKINQHGDHGLQQSVHGSKPHTSVLYLPR